MGGGGIFRACRQCRQPPPYSLISCSPFPFFCSFFIVLPIAPLWAKCHLRAPAPTGREGEEWGGGDYDRKQDERGEKRWEKIKLLLSELARSNAHTKLFGNPI